VLRFKKIYLEFIESGTKKTINYEALTAIRKLHINFHIDIEAAVLRFYHLDFQVFGWMKFTL
jgi:hypothetical protein